MASYNIPQANNPILGDLSAINALLISAAKMDPATGNTNLPSGAKRLTPVSGGYQLQSFDGSKWTSIGKLIHDADTLDGKHANTGTVKDTIPIRNSAGALAGDITGNAASATKLKEAKNIDIGGIASATEQSFDGSKAITIPINSINVKNEDDTALIGQVSKAHGGTGRTDGAAADVIVSSLEGDVKASEYGQIGDAASVSGKDLNSLTVSGHYLSGGGTIENNYPNNYTGTIRIDVLRRGTLVIQYLWQVYSHWRRGSNDSGATWTGWECLGGLSTGGIKIYVSKSGSDLNTGLSSDHPVATLSRAMRIAHNLYATTPTNNTSWVMLCVGEGDWGSLYFQNAPYKLYLRPYDGAIPSEYSDSLPKFTSIMATNSYLVVQGVQTATCMVEANGTCIVDGYFRCHSMAATNQGYLSVNPSTVVDIVNSDSSHTSCLRAYYGGMTVVWENSKINILENVAYTSGFVRCDSSSYLSISESVEITLASNVTVSARKYWLSGPCNIGTMTKAMLDDLPGNQAGSVGANVVLDGVPWGGGDAHTYLAADGSWNKDSTSIYARDVAIGGDAADLASARGFFYDTRLPRASVDGPVTDFNDYTVPGKYHISWREGTPYSNDEGVSIPVTLNNPGALNGSSGFCDAIMEVDYISSASYVSSYARCQQKIIMTSSGTYHNRVFVRVQSVSSGTPWYEWREIMSSSSPKFPGNAGSATKFETGRNITISDASGAHTGAKVAFDGSKDITLKLPSTLTVDISGSASSANNATEWNGAAKTVSTAMPSGGSDGDLWFRY